MPKRRFCGVRMEYATTRGINSLCGVPVRMVYECRLDERCLRKEQTSHARLDDFTNRPPDGGRSCLNASRSRLDDLAPSRPESKKKPSGLLILTRPDAPHRKSRKLKDLQNSIFLMSVFITSMYNPLIAQSESISKLNRDIKES
jgi:hypothetical protein